jgi:hypothetical protein
MVFFRGQGTVAGQVITEVEDVFPCGCVPSE